MASPRTSTRHRSRPGAGRHPAQQRSWLARNSIWLLAALAVAAGAGAFIVMTTSGGSGDESDAGAFVGGDLHSLVVDPADPGRLFVGGHQAVSVTADGGATWRQVPSLEDKDAMGWAFTGDAVYVSGHPGLNRSVDGGVTFTMINDTLPDTDVHAFGAGAGVLYGASPTVGVFASDDAGESWAIRTSATGQAFFGRIIVDPADEQHLLAADAQAGVVQSRDGGRSWQDAGGLPSATWISAAGDSVESLVASGPAGASQSSDGGRSWEPLELPDGALLAELGANADTLYAAGLDGTAAQVWISHDGGATWSEPT